MSALTRISRHVHWMRPGLPDRPSLCAVVGKRHTLLLDAGSSSAHTQQFLDALGAGGGPRPSAVVFTHADWDHVLGGIQVGGLVIAQTLTADRLRELAAWDWSDEGLDRRVAEGLIPPRHVADIKDELPWPRSVHVAKADVVFDTSLDLHLGDVTVRVRHVGGDHSADSCVMLVEPDGVLFLGDCLSGSPEGVLTAARALPLYDAVLGFDAGLYVEGHHDSVSSRAEIASVIEKARAAERAVRSGRTIAAQDEDTAYFLRAFRAGRSA